MKNLTSIFSFILLFLGFSCHKATTKNYTNLVLFPTKQQAFATNSGLWQYTENFSGSGLNNGLISFPLQSADGLIRSYLTYSVLSKKVSYFPIPSQNDTNRIDALYALSSGCYLGICTNRLKGVNYNGINYFQSKLTLLDGNLNSIKQLMLTDTIASFSNIYVDGNGFYYICVRSPFHVNLIYCFDENLTIKWKKELGSTPWGSAELPGLWDVCFIGNFSFHLVNLKYGKYGNEIGRILKLNDLKGNRVNYSSDFKYELNPFKIIKDAVGFRIYGTVSRADKRQILFISRYDTDCNLIETKYLDTGIFSNIDIYSFSFNSNIIDVNGDNYFVVHINNHTIQDTKTNEAKLVKVNKNLELEWAKTLDEFRVVNDRGLLKNEGDKFISIGKSNWNGLEGFSFIQTDLDGNILK